MNYYAVINNLLIGIFIVSLLLGGFLTGYAKAEGAIPDLLGKKIVYNTTTNCTNLDVMQTSVCLRSYLLTFFNYNLSNKNKDLTFDQLKTDGGVCWHYADWYVDMAKQNGMIAQRIDFWGTNRSDGHTITLIYNSNLTEYCLIDQTNLIGCGGLKK